MHTIKLSNGRCFVCKPEQTILDAAREHGIALEHSCRTGRCGVCKAQVLEGTTKNLTWHESLGSDEKAENFILTCCVTALSDVTLDIEDIGVLGRIEVKTLPCRISKLEVLCSDVIEATLRTPPASQLTYLPGQYIDVIGKNGDRRSYSVANAPRADGLLKLQIRKIPEGIFSNYWFYEAKVNDLLRLEGPLGTFCLRPSQASQLVFLATGTGIAPIQAMLEQLEIKSAEVNYDQIHVYWGVPTKNDLYWMPSYPKLSIRFIPVLSQELNSENAKAYVQDAVLADRIALHDAVVYACGSEVMIASARSKLIAAGLNPKDFHSDAFLSSNQILT